VYELILIKNQNVNEVERLEQVVLELANKVKVLEERVKQSPVKNVTFHVDTTRRAYAKGVPVVEFNVDKKFANTILLTNANICAHGETNAETTHFWKYGNGTTVFGQTENYSNNSGYGRPVPCMAIITGHLQTGVQKLSLQWNPAVAPFLFLNPNKLDHPNFYDGQTCSVYTVWELLP